MMLKMYIYKEPFIVNNNNNNSNYYCFYCIFDQINVHEGCVYDAKLLCGNVDDFIANRH